MLVQNMVEGNGKTIKENNNLAQYNIPLDTLVEVDCDYLEEHGTRLYVVKHTRDCDGTPLYTLSFNRSSNKELEDLREEVLKCDYPQGIYEKLIARVEGSMTGGFSEDCLKVVNVN